jgi:hypothetical protein
MNNLQIVFMKWVAELKEEGVHRFLYRGREERLNMLVDDLIKAGIDVSEAQTLKSKIGSILVTKEGYKGKGKYKDWLKNVENEYMEALAVGYADTLARPSNNAKMLPKSAVVTEWCKYTYGEMYNDKIETEARTYGSPIYLKMIREFETE